MMNEKQIMALKADILADFKASNIYKNWGEEYKADGTKRES